MKKVLQPRGLMLPTFEIRKRKAVKTYNIYRMFSSAFLAAIAYFSHGLTVSEFRLLRPIGKYGPCMA